MATATKKRITHVVRKVFSGSGVNYKRGQCVDPSGWRLAHRLEEQERIALIPRQVEPVQSKDGRWWETETLARAADVATGQAIEELTETNSAVVETTMPPSTEKYPRKLERGLYLLSNGEQFKGSKATAVKVEAELRRK